MIGTVLSAAAGVVSSIAGSVAAAKQRKQQQAQLDRQKAENEAWYTRKMHEDATQRADAQRVLSLLSERVRENNQQAQGRQAVVGGTDESLATTQQANAKAMADATSQIAAKAEDRKDLAEASYLKQKDALDAAQNNVYEQKAQNITNATSQALGAAAKLASIEGKNSNTAQNGIAQQQNFADGYRSALHDQSMALQKDASAKLAQKFSNPWAGNSWAPYQNGLEGIKKRSS